MSIESDNVIDNKYCSLILILLLGLCLKYWVLLITVAKSSTMALGSGSYMDDIVLCFFLEVTYFCSSVNFWVFFCFLTL